MKHRNRLMALLLGVAAASTSACDDPSSPHDGGVAVAFAMSRSAATTSSALTLQGTNGTLAIDDLRIIVERFELKRTDDDQCVEEDHSCERFRAPPRFLDIPLDGSAVVAVTQDVEPGSYRRLRFEIEDLDDDEDDPVEAAQIRTLLTQIRSQFPQWPRDASMRVTGTFTPTGGVAQRFEVFFEAEVEIEKEFVPPAIIGSDAARFTVLLDPALWFRTAGGAVLDLSQFDFARTGRIVEFEFEAEDGFTRVEFDD